MYNYVMLIGTLYSKDKDHFILKVKRDFKNEIGNYDADYISLRELNTIYSFGLET